MPILNWLDKERSVAASGQVPYRILETAGKGVYGDPNNSNLLIQGDNLAALKALIPFYAGKVKCVFIDPPYNTQSAFTHYDDNLEHSQWLSLLYPRLELLRELLDEDGSIWVIIDDDEGHYLKVLMDEIFGRKNFVANVVWQKKHTRANDARWFSDNHDHIIIYAKNKNLWKINLLPRTELQNQRFSNPDNDPRGDWASQPIQVKTPNENYIYEIENKVRKKFMPPKGRSWQFSRERYEELVKDNRIWFGKDGENVPRVKNFLSEVQSGLIPITIWSHTEVGHNQDAKQEIKKFNADEVFSTPKPEKLIQRVLQISTNDNDLVLDSFLGSGTTAAVAHKMNRRWIGIEIGEHAQTHCIPRLEKVIAGEQGGISKSINWQGGGGFRFYTLGATVFDEHGSLNAEIKFSALAAHVWYLETRTPLGAKTRSAFLGKHNGTAYYLLYNGILGDRRADGGNVLTGKILNALPKVNSHSGKIVIYGETTRLGLARLDRDNITFKQIPYDVGSL